MSINEKKHNTVDIHALLRIGRIKAAQKDLQGALEVFNEVLAVDENNESALLETGKIYYDLNLYKKAGDVFTKLLEKKGWKLLRINGSHFIYGKTGRDERLSVPIHKNESLKLGLLKHFLQITGILENEL